MINKICNKIDNSEIACMVISGLFGLGMAILFYYGLK